MNIKDSGQRTDFGTGSVRDMQVGKGRMDLLPGRALIHLSKLFEAGCLKYGDRNWEKGQRLSSYVNSCLRHAFKFLCGMTDEDHLVAACWNIMCCLDTLLRIREGLVPNELDDLPGKPSTWAMFDPAHKYTLEVAVPPATFKERVLKAFGKTDEESSHRDLVFGETIREGDEAYYVAGLEWLPTRCAGQTYTPNHGLHRRRSDAPTHVDEGDICPECHEGRLGWPLSVNCSCHINPPCSVCTDKVLTCPKCGWEDAAS